MKSVPAMIVLIGLGCTLNTVSAAEPPKIKPVEGSELVDAPPPALDDPGVKTKPATSANGEAPPDVKVRQEGDDTIEEYRASGKVSMIRITGKSGITKTYIDTDGDGRLEGNPKDGPVAPVYYKLYEWN
jgi:hypothetical protein